MKRVYALSALLLMLLPASATSAQASGSSSVYAMREGYVDANGVMIYTRFSAAANLSSSFTAVRAHPTITFCLISRRSPATIS